MKETNLRDMTRYLLINRPARISIKAIARTIGVSESWLNSFARGEIDNPGVVTIETLNRYLKNVQEHS